MVVYVDCDIPTSSCNKRTGFNLWGQLSFVVIEFSAILAVYRTGTSSCLEYKIGVLVAPIAVAVLQVLQYLITLVLL